MVDHVSVPLFDPDVRQQGPGGSATINRALQDARPSLLEGGLDPTVGPGQLRRAAEAGGVEHLPELPEIGPAGGAAGHVARPAQ